MNKRNPLERGGVPAVREDTEAVGFSDLADAPVTRARAIKLLGATAATGAFALVAGGTAEAGERDRRRRRRRRRRRARLRRQRNITTNNENSTIDLGPVTIGDERFVEVTNEGDVPVTLDPQLIGDDFSLVNTGNIPIAPGDTVRIPVVVDALTGGTANGTLRLLDARDGLLLEEVRLVATPLLP